MCLLQASIIIYDGFLSVSIDQISSQGHLLSKIRLRTKHFNPLTRAMHEPHHTHSVILRIKSSYRDDFISTDQHVTSLISFCPDDVPLKKHILLNVL